VVASNVSGSIIKQGVENLATGKPPTENLGQAAISGTIGGLITPVAKAAPRPSYEITGFLPKTELQKGGILVKRMSGWVAGEKTQTTIGVVMTRTADATISILRSVGVGLGADPKVREEAYQSIEEITSQ
jgi:hypothetical protein